MYTDTWSPALLGLWVVPGCFGTLHRTWIIASVCLCVGVEGTKARGMLASCNVSGLVLPKAPSSYWWPSTSHEKNDSFPRTCYECGLTSRFVGWLERKSSESPLLVWATLYSSVHRIFCKPSLCVRLASGNRLVNSLPLICPDEQMWTAHPSLRNITCTQERMKVLNSIVIQLHYLSRGLHGWYITGFQVELAAMSLKACQSSRILSTRMKLAIGFWNWMYLELSDNPIFSFNKPAIERLTNITDKCFSVFCSFLAFQS